MERYFSPPNRGYPQIIPNTWKFEDGRVISNLQNLSDEELNSLGWHGPIEMPKSNISDTCQYVWNKEELKFDLKELELNDSNISARINFPEFIDTLMGSIPTEYDLGSDLDYENCKKIYTKIREQAKQSLQINTILTEFIFSLEDGVKNVPDIKKIRNILIELFSIIQFTEEELTSLRNVFLKTGMNHIYKF